MAKGNAFRRPGRRRGWLHADLYYRRSDDEKEKTDSTMDRRFMCGINRMRRSRRKWKRGNRSEGFPGGNRPGIIGGGDRGTDTGAGRGKPPGQQGYHTDCMVGQPGQAQHDHRGVGSVYTGDRHSLFL